MKFSIIIPTYNSEKTVSKTILSVLNQSYGDFEIIVVDDCSTDKTLDIVEMCTDPRIRIIKKTIRKGVSDSRNRGIDESKGEYLAFLDSDDIWLPDFLLMVDKNLSEGHTWVFSNYYVINENGQLLEKRFVRPGLYTYEDILKQGNPIGMLTSVVSKNAIGSVKFKDEGHEDYKFWIAIAKKGIPAWNFGDYSAKYLLRHDSLSANKFKSVMWTVKILIHESDGLSQAVLRIIRYGVNIFGRRA